MSGGLKSALAYWIGGASAKPPIKAGFKSLLSFWGGGGNAPNPVTTKPGYRSLLAFWIGGVTTITTTPPVPPVVDTGKSSDRLSRKIIDYRKQYGLYKYYGRPEPKQGIKHGSISQRKATGYVIRDVY